MKTAVEYKSFGPLAISDDFEDSVHGRHRMAKLFGLPFRWPFPIADGLRSSSATVFGHRVFGGGARTPRHIRAIHHLFTRIYEGKLWVRYRLIPKHQYHIVRTGLEPGYYDQDEIILHACMAVLGSYIEEEGGIEAIRSGEGTIHVIDGERRDALLAIWDWWKVQRPADQKRRDELSREIYGKRRMKFKPTANPEIMEWVAPEFSADEEVKQKEFRALEKKIDDDEQKMLHRLIDIRPGLWA